MPTPSEMTTTAASPGIRPMVRHACRRSVSIQSLRPSGELARLAVDFDLLALFDEERNTDLHARLESRAFLPAPAGRTAARARLGGRHRDFHVRREYEADRLVVVGVNLDE